MQTGGPNVMVVDMCSSEMAAVSNSNSVPIQFDYVSFARTHRRPPELICFSIGFLYCDQRDLFRVFKFSRDNGRDKDVINESNPPLMDGDIS